MSRYGLYSICTTFLEPCPAVYVFNKCWLLLSLFFLLSLYSLNILDLETQMCWKLPVKRKHLNYHLKKQSTKPYWAWQKIHIYSAQKLIHHSVFALCIYTWVLALQSLLEIPLNLEIIVYCPSSVQNETTEFRSLGWDFLRLNQLCWAYNRIIKSRL